MSGNTKPRLLLLNDTIMDTTENSVLHQRLQVFREFKADILSFMKQSLDDFQHFATNLIQDIKGQPQQQHYDEGGESKMETTNPAEFSPPPKQESSPNHPIKTSDQDFALARVRDIFGKEGFLFKSYSRENLQPDYKNLWNAVTKLPSLQGKILKDAFYTGFGQEIWNNFLQKLTKWMGEIPTG